MLKLVKVSEKYLPFVIKVVDEFRKFPKEFGRGSIESLLQAIDDGVIPAWIKQKQGEERGINLKPGYVSGTYYWLMDGDDYIGSFTLRHNLTPNLMQIGGNIGYVVDEAYRGRRYAVKACGLLFRQARKHGLEYVIITCDPDNPASARTCELAGGRYLETADIPEDHDMFERGFRQVMIYRFDL